MMGPFRGGTRVEGIALLRPHQRNCFFSLQIIINPSTVMPFNGPVIVGKPGDEAHLISF
jgi:hypothetical protein